MAQTVGTFEANSKGDVSDDVFRTLRAEASAEPPKTKGSRFIGVAAPVSSADAALEVVAEVRRREHSARHHGWAYRLGLDAPAPRSSDDGEPSGSTGVPILREIEGRDLFNTVVVVTRYYGGTKLGVGGLARAYGEAAGLALEAAPLKRVVMRAPVTIAFAFEDTSPAMRLLDVFDAVLKDQSYSAQGTTLRLAVRRSQVADLEAAFVEATAGRGTVVGEAP